MVNLLFEWQRELYSLRCAIKNRNSPRPRFVIYRKSDGFVYNKELGFVEPLITRMFSFEVYSKTAEVHKEQEILLSQGHETGYYAINHGNANSNHWIMFIS